MRCGGSILSYCPRNPHGKAGNEERRRRQRIPLSLQKFQHIHFDLVGPLPVSNDHRYPLTIVDRFSHWFEAIPLKDITAKTCSDAFILHFVARYGSPQTITADRGRQFCSNLWKELTKFLGCELIHTTSYNPKARTSRKIPTGSQNSFQNSNSSK